MSRSFYRKWVLMVANVLMVAGSTLVANAEVKWTYENNVLTGIAAEGETATQLNLTDKGVLSVKVAGTQKEIDLRSAALPSEIPTKIMTIGSFQSLRSTLQKTLQKVYLPESATMISGSAFRDFASLIVVEIPDSVKEIKGYAFDGCTNLTSAIMPGVQSVGDHAFYRCQRLTSVIMPCVTNIDDYAFRGCTSLISAIMPGVQSVGEYAFYGCQGLTSAIMPCATRIEGYSFYNCTNLTSVAIPNVKDMGDDVFLGCRNIKSVEAPTSVSAITYASISSRGIRDLFSSSSSSITQVVISACNTACAIGQNSFNGWKNLVSVTIPSNAVNIGARAFYECSSLTSIGIPNSVTNIGYSAFYGCTNLTSVVVSDSVRRIGKQSFKGCVNLTSVMLSSNLENIEDYSFQNCSSLDSIMIPNSVTNIGGYAFYGCANLTSVVMPNSVTNVGTCSFDNCSNLVSVVISNSMTKGCIFYGCPNVKSVMVPQSVLDYGMNDAFPDSYSSITQVVICAGVTRISSDAWHEAAAFEDCKSLVSVEIPDSVTSIGDSAFQNCSSLDSIIMPNSVTNIGWGAFYNCERLTSIAIPSGVTKLGDYAFDGCKSLTYVEVPQVVMDKKICKVFPDSYSILTQVVIHAGVTGISQQAFEKCENLESVVMPDSITKIGAEAFLETKIYSSASSKFVMVNDWLVSMKGFVQSEVSIPTNVKHIADGVFYRRPNSTITIPASVTSIGDSAFGWSTNDPSSVVTLKFLGKPPVVEDGWFENVEDGIGYCPKKYAAEWEAQLDAYGRWNGLVMYQSDNEDTSEIRYTNLKGAVNSNPTKYTEGTALSFVAPGAVTGYTFTGWTPAEITEEMTGTQRVRANWEANQYAIRYEGNGGVGAIEDSECTYDAEGVIASNQFTRAEYSFLGWAAQMGGPVVYAEGAVVSNLSAEAGGVVTLYAVWKSERVEAPVIVPGDGTSFSNAPFEVAITCATERAAVYFSTNGLMPSVSAANLYEGPFTISDTTTVLAFAVKGEKQSGLVGATFTFTGEKVDPEPMPQPEPEPEPTPEPEPVPEPTPEPDPQPQPEPEPVVQVHYHLASTNEWEAFDFGSAQVYRGYLYDEEDPYVGVGTILVKTAKGRMNRWARQFTSKVTVTIQLLGQRSIRLTGEMKEPDGTIELRARDGRKLRLELGRDDLVGTFGEYTIDGVRDRFSSKVRADKTAADGVLKALQKKGPFIFTWATDVGRNGLSVTVGSKGKTKVALMLANGTKVNVSTTLIIGEEWCAVPIVYSKRGARRAFTVWMALDGSAAEVEGLGDDVLCGRFAAPLKDATLHLDEKEFAALLGEGGTYDLGTLKLTYKAKDGTFTGSVKAYVNNKGKPKTVTVSVSGIMIDGKGYGMATVKKVGSVPITIE